MKVEKEPEKNGQRTKRVTIESIIAEYEKIGAMLDVFENSLPKTSKVGRYAGNQGIAESQKILELMKRNKKLHVDGVTPADIEGKLTILHEMVTLDTKGEAYKRKRSLIKNIVGKDVMQDTKKVKDYVRYKVKSGDHEFISILNEIKSVEKKGGKKRKHIQ
ncbi:MAG: hypothetical protein LBM77_11220 [Spirochaetaceae bacterium]|jgi:hypothetical protein|nr:hypothetical protein [Spirochaetaceae bacterium]